jgi:hypothetical protein
VPQGCGRRAGSGDDRWLDLPSDQYRSGAERGRPAADNAALLAITTKAFHSRDQIAIIAAGKTWAVPNVASPFTGQFEIPAQNAKQALQLQRTLIPSA